MNKKEIMIREFFDNNWLKLNLIILVSATLIFIITLQSFFCTKQTQELCKSVEIFTPPIIEIAIGVGIALLIHNHTRKIQKKDDDELKLTVHGAYLHLWSLHLALIPYINSQEVRADNTTAILILNLINHTQTDLLKSSKLISKNVIEQLQLHLLLIRTAISVSLDPRSDTENYWSQNENKVKIALKEIKNIATKEFEPHVLHDQRLVWKDL